jgi:ferredoxin-NADP reductase
VPERGATPLVSARRRRALALMRPFTSPLAPDDYLELVNPLWSTRELRGRVESVRRETPDTVTVTIKPGWEWPGHRAGQYVRLGIEVDGVHHWRAYSLTSDPARADGRIAITPKLVPTGKVSPLLCNRLRQGTIVRLGGVEGTFTLPDPLPPRLLLLSAGSGVTPIASMVRHLRATREGASCDVVHAHSTRDPASFAFGPELRALAARQSGLRTAIGVEGDRAARHSDGGRGRSAGGYRLHEWLSGARGRLTPAQLDTLCPDWRERDTFLCGPPALLCALQEHWQTQGDPARLHVEHFQPEGALPGASTPGAHGAGGTIVFRGAGAAAHSDGSQPILVAGEAAGVTLPFGCRMGICHSCVGRLRAGQVRDLRTGRVHGQTGELVRTCINAPEGDIEIEL